MIIGNIVAKGDTNYFSICKIQCHYLYLQIKISDRLNRIKRSPNFVSKFKDSFDALKDLQDIELEEWSDNFVANMNKIMETLKITGNNVVDYARYL